MQPALIAGGVQPIRQQHAVVALVELLLPAARERHTRRELGRLPVRARERHLQAHGTARMGVEEALDGRVVGAVRGRAARDGERLAHGPPAGPNGPHDERNRRQRKRADTHLPAPGPRGRHRADQQRPGEQHAVALDVAAHRRRDEQEEQARQQVDAGAEPQPPLLARQSGGEYGDDGHGGEERDRRIGL